MRSPEARKLLNEVLAASRYVLLQEGGTVGGQEALRFLQDALLEYDDFCREKHYSLSMDLASTNTAPYVNTQGTKADHFGLPRGLENS